MKNGRTRMSFMQLMVNVPLRLVSTNKTDPSTKRHNLKKGSVGGFHQYDYDRDVSFGSKGYVDFVMCVYYPLYRTPLFLSCSIQPFFPSCSLSFSLPFYPTPLFLRSNLQETQRHMQSLSRTTPFQVINPNASPPELITTMEAKKLASPLQQQCSPLRASAAQRTSSQQQQQQQQTSPTSAAFLYQQQQQQQIQRLEYFHSRPPVYVSNPSFGLQDFELMDTLGKIWDPCSSGRFKYSHVSI